MDLNLENLSLGEIRLIEWQYRMCGDFGKALWQAITRADNSNLLRLSRGFPDEVEAYRKFTTVSGYWDDVKIRAGIDPDT